MNSLKKCTKCKTDKELSEYHKDSGQRSGYRCRCKECHKSANSTYNKKIRDKRQFYVLKSATRVTKDQYNSLLNLQDNKCAICNKTAEDNKKKLGVDHCHSTLLIRGLLCNRCNMGIGYFNDNHELLIKASEYLKSPINQDEELKFKEDR